MSSVPLHGNVYSELCAFEDSAIGSGLSQRRMSSSIVSQGVLNPKLVTIRRNMSLQPDDEFRGACSVDRSPLSAKGFRGSRMSSPQPRSIRRSSVPERRQSLDLLDSSRDTTNDAVSETKVPPRGSDSTRANRPVNHPTAAADRPMASRTTSCGDGTIAPPAPIPEGGEKPDSKIPRPAKRASSSVGGNTARSQSRGTPRRTWRTPRAYSHVRSVIRDYCDNRIGLVEARFRSARRSSPLRDVHDAPVGNAETQVEVEPHLSRRSSFLCGRDSFRPDEGSLISRPASQTPRRPLLRPRNEHATGSQKSSTSRRRFSIVPRCAETTTYRARSQDKMRRPVRQNVDIRMVPRCYAMIPDRHRYQHKEAMKDDANGFQQLGAQGSSVRSPFKPVATVRQSPRVQSHRREWGNQQGSVAVVEVGAIITGLGSPGSARHAKGKKKRGVRASQIAANSSSGEVQPTVTEASAQLPQRTTFRQSYRKYLVFDIAPPVIACASYAATVA